jgi:uncharacterized protein YjbI with pentapeptide repeats
MLKSPIPKTAFHDFYLTTSMDLIRELPADYQPPESAEEILCRYALGERFFESADLPDRADFRNAVLEDSIFEDVFLSDVDFRGADLKRVSFRNVKVKCSDFRGADLQDACFQGAAVEATLFDGAQLEGTSFAGAGYYGVTLTEGDIP